MKDAFTGSLVVPGLLALLVLWGSANGPDEPHRNLSKPLAQPASFFALAESEFMTEQPAPWAPEAVPRTTVISAIRRNSNCSVNGGDQNKKCSTTSQKTICSARGDRDANCSANADGGASGDQYECSSLTSKNGLCSVVGRSRNGPSFCSATRGPGGTTADCSTIINVNQAGADNSCSILTGNGATANMCSARDTMPPGAGTITCSVHQPPSGTGVNNINKCSVFGRDARGGNTGQCSTFAANTRCSVRPGEQQVQCTSFDGAGDCSTHPDGAGDQDCSVIGDPNEDRDPCP